MRTIGIIGAGAAGSGTAQLSSTAGFDVILIDVSDAAISKGIAAVSGNLDRLVGTGKISTADKDAALARIRGTVTYEALATADVVIEAVPESFKLKVKVLKRSAGP
jgi:3-hydroxybutyryl-CoA dehydrogenase